MKYITTAFFAGILLLSACKKDGLGGDASLGITAKHHGAAIPGTVIYIKYGAEEFPGEDLSLYDATATADNSGYALIDNLRYGKYYLYGVGYDSSVQAIVKGGAPFVIKWSERKDVQEETLSITE